MNNKQPSNLALGTVLIKMIRNAWKQDKRIFGAFVLFTISAAVYPLLAVMLPKQMILFLQGNKATQDIILLAAGYFALALLIGCIRSYSKDSVYSNISFLRMDYLTDTLVKLAGMDYKYTEDANFLEENDKALQSFSSNDNGIEGIYHKLFEGCADALTAVILILVIGQRNLLIVMGLCLHIGLVLWAQNKSYQYRYQQKGKLGHAQRRKAYYYNTTHDFGYGKDIRMYDLRDQILTNYKEEIKEYIDVEREIKQREYYFSLSSIASMLVSNAITYGILVYYVVQGMGIADFSMYLAAVLSLSAVMKNLTEKVSFVLHEALYVQDYYRFIDTDMGEQGGTLPKEAETLEIEFRNVSFRYPKSDQYVFRNLNLHIKKGERLAIVGINGAGKTTLIKLLLGLFTIEEGDILINGKAISEYRKEDLFAMFSVVFQEVNMLAYSIKENVACKSEGIDETRVWDALSRVGLQSKVEQFPQQLDQILLKVIDEEGTELSGGESQKLAIARALYKNANMVIMDEPTAALDALAEADIYRSFNDLVEGKTAIYISHRLASTKFCDTIALFDKQGIVEYGNHEQLMKNQGKYYEMFTIQGKYYQEGVQV